MTVLRQTFDLDGALYKYRDTIVPPKAIAGSFKHSLCLQLQNEQSVLLLVPSPNSLQGNVTEKAAVSRDSSAHICTVRSLEDVNLKDLFHKCCFCGKKTCGGCVLVEESSCPVVSHSSPYLRCPTALVRTSERMM